MSKFSLRKVFALSATVALGSTLIAGLPANAADPLQTAGFVNTAVSSGTGTKIVEGTDLVLNSSVPDNFRCYTTGVSPVTFSNWVDGVNSDCSETGWAATASSSVKWYSPSTDLTLTANANSWTGVTVTASSITADVTADVIPYLDIDGITGWSAGDVKGTATAVTFVNYVEADWVTTVTAVRDSNSTSDLTVTLTPAGTGWNKDQMDDDIDFQMYKNGLVFDTLVSPSGLAQGYSNVGTGVYTARAYLAGTSTTWVGALSAATTVSFQFAEKTVSSITLDPQASANVRTDGDIREGTKAVALTATVRDSSGAPVARAGMPVSFFVSGVNNTASEITFNGTRVTHLSAATVEIKTVTDAKGVATLNVANSVGKIGDTFGVYASVINSAGTYVTTTAANAQLPTEVYNWVAAVATNLDEKHDVGANSNVINSVKGQSYTLEWSVTDNFGQPYAGTDARVYYYDDDDGSFDSNLSGYVAVVNGKASLTVNESASVQNDYELESRLQIQVPNTNNWNTVTSTNDIDVYVVVNNTPGKLDVNSSSSSVPVTYDEFANNNFNLVTEYNTLFQGVYGPYVTLTGTVVDSNGLVLPGAPVTLRGNGIFFDAGYNPQNSGSQYGIYSENSITVYANSNGVYEVYFASHKSGKQTITATSGSASATESLTVLAPSYDFAYDVKVTGAPKSVSAGNRVLSVSFAVVDYWGNTVSHTADVTRYNEYQYFDQDGNGDMYAPFFGAQLNRSMIDFSVYSDKGLILAQSPVAGDLAVYTARVLLQTRDLGPTTVGINWGADLEMNNGGTFILSNSATVWSGPAVTAYAGAKKGRVVVEAYRAVGRTVTVTVGKTKTTFVPNKANDKFVVKGIKKGNRNVTVTISGIGYDFKKSKIAVK